MVTSAHTLRGCLDEVMPALLEIPGVQALLDADDRSYPSLAEAYPDAVFTILTMNNLFHHDREFSEIHQQAFFSIVDGMDIPTVRRRYSQQMDRYWENHLRDD